MLELRCYSHHIISNIDWIIILKTKDIHNKCITYYVFDTVPFQDYYVDYSLGFERLQNRVYQQHKTHRIELSGV